MVWQVPGSPGETVVGWWSNSPGGQVRLLGLVINFVLVKVFRRNRSSRSWIWRRGCWWITEQVRAWGALGQPCLRLCPADSVGQMALQLTAAPPRPSANWQAPTAPIQVWVPSQNARWTPSHSHSGSHTLRLTSEHNC